MPASQELKALVEQMPDPDDRQMLAAPSAARGIGEAGPADVWAWSRRTTIGFLAPPALFESWDRALHRLRAARGALPTWACAVLLVRHALEVWLVHDSETRPSEHPILERDDYACRAPGCSSRRNLAVHHIQFRSQGGTDHAWNQVTLCHIHHHHEKVSNI